MRTGICLSAIMVVAALGRLAGQEQPPASAAAAPTQSSSAPPYRMLQLVSAGNTEQGINVAAAAGYQFLMLQPTAGAAGVTVLMRKTDTSAAPYQYRVLLAGLGNDRLQRALQQAGGAGFRLVADSLVAAPALPRGAELLLWPSAGADEKHKVTTYVAVMEKAPGAAATYDYRVTKTVRLASLQKELSEVARQGFTPVAATIDPVGLGRYALVWERNPSEAPAARGQYAYVKICEFLSPRDLLTELTADVPIEAGAEEPQTANEKDRKVESQEPRDTAQTPGDADSEYAPPKPRLQSATIAGSRLIFLTHFVHADSVWLLAEKHPQAPPPVYRLVLRADSAGLEETLNSSAREGFRLFTAGIVDTARSFDSLRGEVHDIRQTHLRLNKLGMLQAEARNVRRIGQVLAVLQRDTTATRHQYRILHAEDAVALLKQMNEASAQGYAFSYMWENNVVMEKPRPDSPSDRGGS